MRKLLVLSIVAMMIFLSSCTENSRAKSFGGTAILDLPKGEKLVTVTWKEDALWYLTRPMTSNDKAEVYSFAEESSWGVFEGTYKIKEQK